MTQPFIPTPAELEAAATRQRDLPLGFVEIGIGKAVRLDHIVEVQESEGATGCLVHVDTPSSSGFATSPLTYHALLERMRQAQRAELAEPGDPEVVHLLREALDQLTEDRRTLLEATVRAAIGLAHQALYPVSLWSDELKDLADLKAGEAYDPRRSAVAAADATDQLTEG